MKKLLSVACFLLSVTCFLQASQPRSDKRGAGTNNMAYRMNYEVLSPGMSWFYNWSSSAPALIQNDWESLNMEYVPMIWGGGIDNETGRQRVRAYLREHPSIRYILGFNEPNFTSQSRMTPQYAAQQWPYIEELADEFGLTIVGPALNYGPPGGSVRDSLGQEYTDPFRWYDDFFLACPDCRVDHIAIHLYMPGGALEGVIEEFWRKYQRPIWLTEFNRNAGGASTPEDHIGFLTTELEMLEKNPHIFRYAWFMTYSSVWQINLLDLGEGNLSDLGKVYVGMSSFDSTYYHPVGEPIPAAHYQSAKSVTIRPTTSPSSEGAWGCPLLMLKDMSTGSWAEYLVDVPATGTYDLTLHLACKTNSKIEVYEDDLLLTTLQPTATCTTDFDTWGTQSFSVNLSAGHRRLKLRSMGRLYYYDWLSLDQPTSIYNHQSTIYNQKSLTPDGQLLIHTAGRTYNAQGQTVR